MKTLHATFEMDNLGVNAYETRIEPEDTPQEYARAEQTMLAEGAQYLVVKTPVNDARWLFELPKLGYQFVETVFHVAMRKREYHPPTTLTRLDRGLSVVHRTETADLDRVFALIRAGVFKSDRVSIDPAFTLQQSGNRYANWLRQMLRGGALLFEVLSGEKPIGFFVITRVDEQTVDPVLMGLYDEANDRGLGALLHKKMLDTCFEQPCTRLTSTIVSNNAKVLRVYVNAGASIADTQYTYVKHVAPNPGE